MKSTTSLRRVGCLHAQLAPSVQVASAEEREAGLFRNNLATAADDGGKKVVAEEDPLLFPSPVQAMAREREAVSFDVRRLTHLLEGEEGTKWLDLAAQLIERDPVLYDGHVSSHDLTVPEHREKCAFYLFIYLDIYPFITYLFFMSYFFFLVYCVCRSCSDYSAMTNVLCVRCRTMRKIARYMEYVRRGPLSANEPLHQAFNRYIHAQALDVGPAALVTRLGKHTISRTRMFACIAMSSGSCTPTTRPSPCASGSTLRCSTPRSTAAALPSRSRSMPTTSSKCT